MSNIHSLGLLAFPRNHQFSPSRWAKKRLEALSDAHLDAKQHLELLFLATFPFYRISLGYDLFSHLFMIVWNFHP
jgi:hypothetical protein